jgi:hypothetical protein
MKKFMMLLTLLVTVSQSAYPEACAVLEPQVDSGTEIYSLLGTPNVAHCTIGEDNNGNQLTVNNGTSLPFYTLVTYKGCKDVGFRLAPGQKVTILRNAKCKPQRIFAKDTKNNRSFNSVSAQSGYVDILERQGNIVIINSAQ